MFTAVGVVGSDYNHEAFAKHEDKVERIKNLNRPVTIMKISEDKLEGIGAPDLGCQIAYYSNHEGTYYAEITAVTICCNPRDVTPSEWSDSIIGQDEIRFEDGDQAVVVRVDLNTLTLAPIGYIKPETPSLHLKAKPPAGWAHHGGALRGDQGCGYTASDTHSLPLVR